MNINLEYPALLHDCREGMHAERLLNARLFAIQPTHISNADRAYAEQVTCSIIQRLDHTLEVLTHQPAGRRPIHLEYDS